MPVMYSIVIGIFNECLAFTLDQMKWSFTLYIMKEIFESHNVKFQNPTRTSYKKFHSKPPGGNPTHDQANLLHWSVNWATKAVTGSLAIYSIKLHFI